MFKAVLSLLIVLAGNLPAQTLLTRTSIALGESPTQAGKLIDQGRTYTPFLFGFTPEGDLLLADVYKNRIAVYTLEGKLKTSWEPGTDYGPWISYFYPGTQRVLWGDARKLSFGPLGGGQTSSLNLGGLFPTYRGVSGGKVSLGISSEGRSESLVMPEDLSSSKRVYKTGSDGKNQAVAWGWGGDYFPVTLAGMGTFLGNEPGGPAYYVLSQEGSTVVSLVDTNGKLVKSYRLSREGSLPESGLWTVYQPGKVVAQLFAWEDRVEVVRWRLE